MGDVQEVREERVGSGTNKLGKILQHCTIFCNQKSAKRQEPTQIEWELGLKGTRGGKFEPLCPPL